MWHDPATRNIFIHFTTAINGLLSPIGRHDILASQNVTIQITIEIIIRTHVFNHICQNRNPLPPATGYKSKNTVKCIIWVGSLWCEWKRSSVGWRHNPAKRRFLVKISSDWNISHPRLHDDVIKWKHFSHYWPFVRGIHRSPVNSSHKSQLRGALMFSFICAWISGWVNNREVGDLRRHRAHYDVIVMV